MRKRLYMLLTAAAMLLSLSACRDEADHLLAYGQKDALAFSAAENKFAEKFKIVWEGLNCNYALWDYETSFGLDWDRVWDEYLPRFQALDDRPDSVTVSDDELRGLLEELVAPLHDGHLYVQMKNHTTGNFVGVMPSRLRNQSRADYRQAALFQPSPEWYRSGDHALLEYDTYSTYLYDTYTRVDTTAVLSRITSLKEKQQPSDLDLFMIRELEGFMADYRQVNSLPSSSRAAAFNRLTTRYGQYDIPGLSIYPKNASDNAVRVKYALFPGNIVYLFVDAFRLTSWLEDKVEATTEEEKAVVKEMSEGVLRVWAQWFKKVQELHKAGTLGGVIIDVRGNPGGMVSDFQYVMGALLPKENFVLGQARFKSGVGRLDYSVLMPQTMPTLNVDREEITEPVVVLANCHTVSMGESTALAAKLMNNGRLVGTQTWGGLCLLINDPAYYSLTYAGCIGVQDDTPVYCFIPFMALITEQEGILEGVGLTPDIEVPLDDGLLQQKRDSQLERALQYLSSE